MTSTADSPALRVRDARLSYGGRLLFDGLDCDLPEGQTTCLLGPSGVGKSSLLRLIAGLQHAAEGSVRDAEGRPLAGRLAYMAQQDLLLPWLSVLDNITLGARLRGDTATPAKAGALLEAVGLGAEAAQLPATLSGGMRQRAALARTLMEERPIVLMDEPFSALDAITRLEIQSLAAKLLAGRSVLVVTHDPLEALRLGHRILIMAGRPAQLEELAPPAGDPPRAPGNPALLERQAALLERLGRARAA
ncbi:MAG: ABC transporter ATP-binding protein [Rhodovibrionaceae bacterium]